MGNVHNSSVACRETNIKVHGNTRWTLYRHEAKQLFDSGITKYIDIARLLWCTFKLVVRCAKKDGWYERRVSEVSWTTPANVPECSIRTYGRYSHKIRHYTNVIYKRYSKLLDPTGLRGIDFHIDHKLSVYDAYNSVDRPIPWQLICHPANLELLSNDENYLKGSRSSFSPKQLLKAIKVFDRTHGTVFLPIEIGVDRELYEYAYKTTAQETVEEKIKAASSFSLSDLKKLKRSIQKVPVFAKRHHLERKHYRYILWALLQGQSQVAIAEALGTGKNIIQCAILRLNVLTTQQAARYISDILNLKDEGLRISGIAKELNITPLQVLFCYLKFKE